MRGLTLIAAALLLTATANAQDGPNAAVQAKVMGLLLNVPLESVPTESLDQHAAAAASLALEIEPGCSCGYPHRADSDIAFATPAELVKTLGLSQTDAEMYQQIHESALATGSGAYPAGCNPKYPGVHAINWTINVNSFNATSKRPLTDEEFQGIIDSKVFGPSGDPHGRPFTMAELKKHWGGKPMWSVLMDFTAECNRRIGIIQTPILVRGPPINISVLSRPIPGSTIGIGWFPGSDPCPGDHVEFHIDSGYRAGFQGQFGLWLHENGHCLKLQHQFNGQDRHQGPMSYRFRNHLVYGWVKPDMVDLVGLPVSPSVPVLTRLYGGEPVGTPWAGKFGDEPEDPPTPPTGGGNGWTVGQLVSLNDGVKEYTLRVITVDGDQGDTFADRVAAEFAKIPDYRNKEKHRATMASVYYGLSRSIAEEGVTVDDAHDTADALRGLLLRRDEDKWEGVWVLADSTTNAGGFMSVATGLGYKPGDESGWTAADFAYMVGYAQAMVDSGDALNPVIIQVIKSVLTFIPDGPLKTIIGIVLAILEGLPAEEAELDEGPIGGFPRTPTPADGVRYIKPAPTRRAWFPFGVGEGIAV